MDTNNDDLQKFYIIKNYIYYYYKNYDKYGKSLFDNLDQQKKQEIFILQQKLLELYEKLKNTDDISEQIFKDDIKYINSVLSQNKIVLRDDFSSEEKQQIIDKLIKEYNNEKCKTVSFKDINKLILKKDYELINTIKNGWNKINDVDKNKLQDLRIRVSDNEKTLITENSIKNGYKNVSDFIREVSINYTKQQNNNYLKYELSSDYLGLVGFFMSDSKNMVSVHIHVDDLTSDQKIIRDLLMVQKLKELDSINK